MSGVPDVVRDAYLMLRGRAVAPAPTRTMRGHTAIVWAAAFFKDSRRVVTASYDYTLRIWDVEKGDLVGEPFKGHRNWVKSVSISPDQTRIASGAESRVSTGTIIIWDVESNQKVLQLTNHKDSVWAVSFSPDGTKLASGSYDKTVIIWDAITGAVLQTFKGYYSSVATVAFSPNGQELASTTSGIIRIYRTDNAEELLKINHDANSLWSRLIRSVAWSPDGQQFLSASEDQTIKFWNSSNGDQIGQPCIGHTHHITSLAISSGGSFIATSSNDTTVRLWSTKTHKQIGQSLEHDVGVYSVTISPNEELLVSGDDDGVVSLWSIKSILEQHDAEERILEDERLRLLFGSDTQLPVMVRGHNNINDEPTGETHFLFDRVLGINMTVHNASIAGGLHLDEELLTRETDADGNNHDTYADRSVVRARNFEWESALQDAVKSIAIQPSLLGHISKGIALCGNQQFYDAMEAFDLAFIFLNRDPIAIDFLFLIKAIALFNANRHDEAMRRVQELSTAYQRSGTSPYSIVNVGFISDLMNFLTLERTRQLYLRMRLAIIAFKDGRYSEAADRLSDGIPSITDLFFRGALFEPRLKIFTVLFGWDLDSLWETVNQRRCEAFLRADRVVEAVEAHQYMMHRTIEEAAKPSFLKWSTGEYMRVLEHFEHRDSFWCRLAFKQDCTVRCITKGDAAAAESNYEMAIELYSAAIALDSSCHSSFAHRSKAKLAQNLYVEALDDAEKVVEIDPSSYIGYELKHTALQGAQRYGEAVQAFKTMLYKLDDSPDAEIRKLRQQYVSPVDVENAFRTAVHAHLENAPLRLINTSTGRLCDRQAQIHTFTTSNEYKELLYSSMTRAHLQTRLIKEAVEKYFRWVMLSHRWESKEPLLHNIRDTAVYDLDPVGTVVKLQMFCQTAREAGYCWAWSDTCCIDQTNNKELQESVNSMFVWYRLSALTIVYLSDVPPSSDSGALANSTWNTRGWTVQEFLAPNIVLFYQADWSLYLNDRSSNHKESTAIMQELERSTGINHRALVAFRPGMGGTREKLQWASSRTTTLQEDIAYSLFGIFRVHLNVIYGEKKDSALGRLLQEIIAHSGDISALDWVGKSSEFNSCLPADIFSYRAPPCTPPSLSEDEMQILVSTLQNSVAVESASKLYTILDDLSAPRFATSRLQLPCIVFPVTEVRRRRDQDQESCFTYDIKAAGLQDLTITTQDKLAQFLRPKSTQQTFLLARPWNRQDLGLPDFADDTQSMDGSVLESPLDDSFSDSHGENEPVDMDSQSRKLRLIVRLGQPFGALFLAKQRGGEYKRIVSDINIMARVKDMAAVHDMMDIRTLEIL
uniref:Heterokaryon incompatibility domain-containing protein n=1 Tax=Suillus grevillei TaxID=5382 RepID=I6NPC2_SUIGR|nr:hypothetical protein [Suillus grevillei]